ncbi:MAG: diaminopimelate epimerase [Dokdonella sp.]|uniref:diaminopimelate epimerase n=1 Tax=Dokdonella sp. TaxID=2291710 RepID=UPI0025BEF330|nr:diaminopimelate epimerase [Dokdonella sp.]MBK8123747.1 diaminopimelate epimerase [Dokdonella sp.]
MALAFSKMHGLGNDFVILDCREHPLALTIEDIRRLADRHRGVGFDQLLSIHASSDPAHAFAYGIWNRDGSPSGQCGNGVRCVAAWLAREGALDAAEVSLMSPSGPVRVACLADGRVRVNMGEPDFSPATIPLAVDGEADTYRTRIDDGTITFAAVSMGNPHAVIAVDGIAQAHVTQIGARLSSAAIFPQGCNVGFVERRSRTSLALRVWERGVGETLACGTGACAAMAVQRKRGAVDDTVDVQLPGGSLEIHWQGPGHPLWMTGPASFSFEGTWHE